MKGRRPPHGGKPGKPGKPGKRMMPGKPGAGSGKRGASGPGKPFHHGSKGSLPVEGKPPGSSRTGKKAFAGGQPGERPSGGRAFSPKPRSADRPPHRRRDQEEPERDRDRDRRSERGFSPLGAPVRAPERPQAGGPPSEPAGEVLFGVHPVIEALRGGGRPIERVYVSRDRHDSRVAEAHRHARERGIPMQFVPVPFLDRLSRGGNHQGILATVGTRDYVPAEELIEKARHGGILLAIDGVQDPRNLGAILRTAAGCGVRGVFIPVHGASGLTPVVARTAAGAMEKIAVARVTNIAALVVQLQEQGFTTYGLDAGGEQDWSEPVYPERAVLVVGGEEGLRELVRKRCDHRIRIPMAAGTESLNVSVAAAVALYEMVRQRGLRGKGPED